MKHILSLGLGVQSTTMFYMAALGEIEPRPKAAIFADPGSEREQSYVTLGHLQEHGDRVGIPVYVVRSGNLFEEMIRKPSPAPPLYIRKKDGTIGTFVRQCTANYKIKPIGKLSRSHFGASAKTPIVQWIGISLDEAQRMKPSREKAIIFRHPLIEKRMTRVDCYHWLKAHNFPIPVSSACIGCPYSRDHEFAKLTDEEIEYLADWEERLHERWEGEHDVFPRSYIHRSARPFRERPWLDSVNPDQGKLELEFDDKDSLCDEGGCFL